MKRAWGIFISGRGSNLQTLLDWDDRVAIKAVISSREKAQGLLRARRFGVSSLRVITKNSSWEHLHRLLVDLGVNKVFLLGFMKIVPASFIEEWRGVIYNVHPSLLPLHAGIDGLKQGWELASPLGVTVHHVNEEMDAGAQIFQGTYSRENADYKKIVRRNAWMERRLISEVVCR